MSCAFWAGDCVGFMCVTERRGIAVMSTGSARELACRLGEIARAYRGEHSC